MFRLFVFKITEISKRKIMYHSIYTLYRYMKFDLLHELCVKLTNNDSSVVYFQLLEFTPMLQVFKSEAKTLFLLFRIGYNVD